MRWRIGLAACVAVGLTLLPGAGRTNGEGKEAADKLHGTWSVVSLVADGKDNTDAKDDKVTFDAGKITIKSKNNEHGGAYTLDPSKKPGTIDLTPQDGPEKGKILKGIYSVQGDELKLCWHRMPDSDRPTKFESTEGSGLMLVTLKREKP